MRTRYFDRLNYTLGDEDTSVEMALLPPRCKTICAIAGSGGRVLPLLAQQPANLICVDILQEQLHLTALRLAAVRRLSHADYCAFWGIPGTEMSPGRRKEVLAGLDLPREAVTFLTACFEKNRWRSLLLAGKFEQTLVTLSRINHWVTGAKGRDMFHCPDLAAQRAYASREFPRTRWKIILALLGNSAVLNSLLYKGDFPKKNIPGSTYNNFERIFNSIFQTIWLRKSFFAQLCFFGELIYPEAALIECDPLYFERIKRGLASCEVTLVQGDVLKVIAESKEEIDFVSLSDVPSFFQGAVEQQYLQAIRERIAPGGLVVVRGNLRVTRPDASGFSHLADAHLQDIVRAETTQLWNVDVYQKERLPSRLAVPP